MTEPSDLEAVQAHARRIARSVARRATPEDREDLVQDVLIKYAGLAADQQPDNIEAWLTTVLKRTHIDRVRAAAVRPTSDDELELILENVAGKSLSLMPVREDLITRVFALVPEDARLLRGKYIERLTSAELGEELGIAANAVDQRLSRARRRLREMLETQEELLAELKAPHPHLYPGNPE